MRVTVTMLAVMLAIIVMSGCSSTRPAQSAEGLMRRAMERLCNEYALPGMTVAWAADGRIQGSVAIGWADIERGEPMKPTTRMLAASIGKSFVGALCVALDQEGRLSLDDPITRWLGHRPWLTHLPNHGAITLRHLLTHTAGIPDHVHTDGFSRAISAAWPDGQNHFSPDDLVAYVLDEPALFQAGQGWSYSDTGYILAGLIIESATGLPLFQQISERFLVPLGLDDTEPSDHRELAGLAAGYSSPRNPFGFPGKATDPSGRLRWHPGIEWAGGGLVSSSPDLARWGAALFGRAGVPGVPVRALLATVSMSDADPSRRYGLGVGVAIGGRYGPVYGHAGWIPGYVSSLRHYPDLGLTIAMQINTDAGIVDVDEDVLGRIEMRMLRVLLDGDR